MERIMIDNYSLAMLICQELVHLGLRQNLFSFDSTFLPSELERVESLVITGCDDLRGINQLPNLKYLTILGVNLNSFQRDSNLQNHIRNFEYINDLISLERLSILYDNEIETLNVSELSHLKSLKLFCNSKLKKIVGLDKHKQLDEISICNCPIHDIGDVKQYLDNTKDTAIHIWDINMFVTLLKEPSIRTYLKGKMYDNLTNLSFGEHIYFHNEVYIIDWYQMNDMYNRANRILRELQIEQLPDREKVYHIYQYVVGHLQYDYEGLQYRDKNYKFFEDMSGEEQKYFIRRLATINSSFGAITRKKVVCDGYVNLMRFLLNFYGIPSQTVICSHQDRLHSAIKFQIDNTWYYADPEQDQRMKSTQYFGLTYKEFSSIYKLSLQEQMDNQIEEEGITYGQYTI